MRRFVVEQNILRYESLLHGELDPGERAQVLRLLAEAREELGWLEDVWQKTCPSLFIPDALGRQAEQLLAWIVMVAHADFGTLQVWDDENQTLHLVAHNNLDITSARKFAHVHEGDGTLCDAARVTGTPIVIGNLENDREFAVVRDWAKTMGIRSITATPVFDGVARFVGVFSVYHAATVQPSPDTANLVGTRIGELGSILAKMTG